MKLVVNLVCCFFVFVHSVQAQVAEVTYDQIFIDASTRALQRIEKANEEGIPVNEAHELIVHRDRLCILAFQYVKPGTMKYIGGSCTEHAGAYEKYLNQLDQVYVRSVRRFLFDHSVRGSPADLQRLLAYEDIFAELQYLVRTDVKARDRLLEIMIGHSGAAYVAPGTTYINLP